MRLSEFEMDVQTDLTPTETVETTRELCESIETLRGLRLSKKAADAEFKEQVEQYSGTMTQCSIVLQRGWRYKKTAVKVLWNSPKQGEKTIVRLDTGEEVRVQPMTLEERQEELDLK